MVELNSLDAISPVDGRYKRKTERLGRIVSERGLMVYRTITEGEYLIYLSDRGMIKGQAPLTHEEKWKIRDLCRVLSHKYSKKKILLSIIKELEGAGFCKFDEAKMTVKI